MTYAYDRPDGGRADREELKRSHRQIFSEFREHLGARSRLPALHLGLASFCACWRSQRSESLWRAQKFDLPVAATGRAKILGISRVLGRGNVLPIILTSSHGRGDYRRGRKFRERLKVQVGRHG